MDYPLIVVPASDEDGGGFMVYAPDLVGCMSDGDTAVEAVANGQQAVKEWLETAHKRGLAIPRPGSGAARARDERDNLLNHLKALSGRVDGMEARFEELRRTLLEIEERIEHQDAWARFADITSLPVGHESPVRHGNC